MIYTTGLVHRAIRTRIGRQSVLKKAISGQNQREPNMEFSMDNGALQVVPQHVHLDRDSFLFFFN